MTLIALALALCTMPQSPATLRGTVAAERPATGSLRVELRRLRTGANGRVETLDRLKLYERPADAVVVADAAGGFTIEVAAGPYAAFAYADADGDGRWTPGVPEPCAFTARCDVDGAAGAPVALVVRAPRHLPRSDREVEHGALRWMRGYPVVQLRGTAAQRGRAHGELLAAQIVDFFRFYVLEDRLGGADAYRDFATFLETKFAWSEALLTELDGVLAGMRAGGADLDVPELGRAFSRTELLAINAYVETRAMRSSCTQFACWGERTAGTDVQGGTIAGRNMDGEIDLRRVTVSHFVLFATAPSEAGHKRYVSMMWPGFVGTLSGFNEDGLHCMENAGGTGPGPVVDRLQPISWLMREALVTLGADATPAHFERLLASNANSAGGACAAGCILLFALPHEASRAPAWVLEGDRFGHATRLPGAVAPQLTGAVLASNHHLAYGVDPARPGLSFGKEPSPSSRWRYEAGRARLEGWSRTGRKVGTAEMKDLLQTVAHGTTEHSIITRPDRREFEVAVASMAAEPWDAPYRAWTVFTFSELFEARAVESGASRR
ncbi:MAG TPA: C45 family autoproteolytic acyltransferase/hydrolase [Planctomycetota bacterium]